MNGEGGRTFAEQEVDGEVDHVRGHGAEGEDHNEPDDARQHAVVDGPVRDLVQELTRPNMRIRSVISQGRASPGGGLTVSRLAPRKRGGEQARWAGHIYSNIPTRSNVGEALVFGVAVVGVTYLLNPDLCFRR